MQVALSQTDYETHAFDPLGGDSFYMRAHFNFESQNPIDLSFKINDILHVTDTLYNGVMGQWVATKLAAPSISNADDKNYEIHSKSSNNNNNMAIFFVNLI